MVLSLFFQTKELAKHLLTNFENAPGRLLQQSSHQPGNERRLIELLVHFLIVVKCLPQNRLLQPLVNLACNPALMKVWIRICKLFNVNEKSSHWQNCF